MVQYKQNKRINNMPNTEDLTANWELLKNMSDPEKIDPLR